MLSIQPYAILFIPAPRNHTMRGQASSEFIVIIAALTMIMMPVLIIMNVNAQYSQESMALARAAFSAARLASAADSVGSMGLGARLYTTIDVPTLDSIAVSGHDIAFRMNTSYGPVVVVQASRFQLGSSPDFDRIKTAGTYTVEVQGPERVGQNEKVTLILR